MRLLVLIPLILLSGCLEMKHSTQRVGNTMNREAEYSRQKFEGYFDMREPPKPVAHAIQSRYCYQALSDIICYKDPLPNSEDRLVGFQEPLVDADTYVYTDASGRSGTAVYVGSAPDVAGQRADSAAPWHFQLAGPRAKTKSFLADPPVIHGSLMTPSRYSGMEEVKYDPKAMQPKPLVK